MNQDHLYTYGIGTLATLFVMCSLLWIVPSDDRPDDNSRIDTSQFDEALARYDQKPKSYASRRKAMRWIRDLRELHEKAAATVEQYDDRTEDDVKGILSSLTERTDNMADDMLEYAMRFPESDASSVANETLHGLKILDLRVEFAEFRLKRIAPLAREKNIRTKARDSAQSAHEAAGFRLLYQAGKRGK